MPIFTLQIETGVQIFLTLCFITVLIVVVLTECIFMLLGKTQAESKNTVYGKLPKEVLTWFPIFLSILIFFTLSKFSQQFKLNMPIIIGVGFLIGTVSTAFYSGGLKRILKTIKHICPAFMH